MATRKQTKSKKNIIINRRWTIEAIGWVGVAIIFTAYALASLQFIDNRGPLFQLMNLLGALGVVIFSVYKKSKQTALLNSFWALIAIIALVKVVS